MRVSLRVGIVVFWCLTACGPVDRANEHLGQMDDTSKKLLEEMRQTRLSLETASAQSVRIADALVEIKKLGADAMALMVKLFEPKSPQKTPDLADVLGGQG